MCYLMIKYFTFQDDDDDLYDFTNDVEDPWNDDDLGFGISRNAPPSQPGENDVKAGNELMQFVKIIDDWFVGV